jgi:hypothetical protein
MSCMHGVMQPLILGGDVGNQKRDRNHNYKFPESLHNDLGLQEVILV